MGPKTEDATQALSTRLRQVYWIGGGSGAGKSTIARRLAAQYGLSLLATDAAMTDHASRITLDDCPFLSDFVAMDMDQRWANRDPGIMLDTFHWFRGEGFGLIVEDILRQPEGSPVIVEGFRLLPRLVKPLLGLTSRAIWLLPTPDFRRAAFDSRGTAWEIPRRTSNPERALRNLLERDRLFTERLRNEANLLDLAVVDVRTAMTEDDLAAQVTESFEL